MFEVLLDGDVEHSITQGKVAAGGQLQMLIVAPDGKVIYRKMGSIEPLEVKRTIADTLGRTYATKGK